MWEGDIPVHCSGATIGIAFYSLTSLSSHSDPGEHWRGATARAVLLGEFGFKQEGQIYALSISPFGLILRSCPE